MTSAPLPEGLERLLQAAGASGDRPAEAAMLIEQALREYPDAEATHIAAYRFYFYRNDFDRALAVAADCLRRVQAELGLPADWRVLCPDGSDFTDPARPRHRFLLFSLSAYGYLLARLGRADEATAALAVLASLDPEDRFGAARLREVIRRGPDDD